MKVRFKLTGCLGECRYAFLANICDKNGLRNRCNHPEAPKPKGCEEYDRLLPSDYKVPGWCPLRHGGKYQ